MGQKRSGQGSGIACLSLAVLLFAIRFSVPCLARLGIPASPTTSHLGAWTMFAWMHPQRSRSVRRTAIATSCRTLHSLDKCPKFDPNHIATSLPLRCNLLYVTESEQIAGACAELETSLQARGELPPALGFDIEWKVVWGKGQRLRPAATLQLATRDLAVVFHLSCLQRVPDPVMQLLERQDVLKVGVGASGDARKLERDYFQLEAVNASSCTRRARSALNLEDLERHTNLSQLFFGRNASVVAKRQSLAHKCEDLLGWILLKPNYIRCGNWETVPLSSRQLSYAATDAWVSLLCFDELHARSPGALAQSWSEDTGLKKSESPERVSNDRTTTSQGGAGLSLTAQTSYDLFFEDGLSVHDIARERGFKTTTIVGHLADSIHHGFFHCISCVSLFDAVNVS